MHLTITVEKLLDLAEAELYTASNQFGPMGSLSAASTALGTAVGYLFLADRFSSVDKPGSKLARRFDSLSNRHSDLSLMLVNARAAKCRAR